MDMFRTFLAVSIALMGLMTIAIPAMANSPMAQPYLIQVEHAPPDQLAYVNDAKMIKFAQHDIFCVGNHLGQDHGQMEVSTNLIVGWTNTIPQFIVASFIKKTEVGWN